MTTHLLDANVLIALTVREHEHHERASLWAADIDSFALCPISEGALIRFLLRLGESVHTAKAILAAVHEREGFEFWADSLSYVDTDLDHVVGHRQVTDAYLVGLTRGRVDARLATLDRALAAAAPEITLLLPEA